MKQIFIPALLALGFLMGCNTTTQQPKAAENKLAMEENKEEQNKLVALMVSYNNIK